MPNIDLQSEIFKNLSLKPVIRFRSLSTALYSLIHSSHFISSHDSPVHHLLIRYGVDHEEGETLEHVCYMDDDTFPGQRCDLTIPPLIQRPADDQTKMIGSSHGLLYFTTVYRGSIDSPLYYKEMAALWNPAICNSILVVMPNQFHVRFSYSIGFGVCPHTKDPMLVCVRFISEFDDIHGIDSIPCQVLVFTLSSGEWTTSSSINLPRKSIEFTSSQTSVGQFIYWLVYDRTGDTEYRSLIMSFDMSTQEFRGIDLPDCLSEMSEAFTLISRIAEHLVVVDYTVEDFANRIRKHVGQGLGKMANQTRRLLVAYDPSLDQIKDIGIFGRIGPISATLYKESLLLLNYDDGHIVGSAIWEEDAARFPFVGDKVLNEQYVGIRRTLGGNCFFRSFMFSYLKLVEEAIEKIKNGSAGTVDSVVPPMHCRIKKEISNEWYL